MMNSRSFEKKNDELSKYNLFMGFKKISFLPELRIDHLKKDRPLSSSLLKSHNPYYWA